MKWVIAVISLMIPFWREEEGGVLVCILGRDDLRPGLLMVTTGFQFAFYIDTEVPRVRAPTRTKTDRRLKNA
jgi:hypothetical protein